MAISTDEEFRQSAGILTFDGFHHGCATGEGVPPRLTFRNRDSRLRPHDASTMSKY
jgi:hypothetical protein